MAAMRASASLPLARFPPPRGELEVAQQDIGVPRGSWGRIPRHDGLRRALSGTSSIAALRGAGGRFDRVLGKNGIPPAGARSRISGSANDTDGAKLADSAMAATFAEEKESTRLLRAAEAALGLSPSVESTDDDDDYGDGTDLEGSAVNDVGKTRAKYRQQTPSLAERLADDRDVSRWLAEVEDADDLAELLLGKLAALRGEDGATTALEAAEAAQAEAAAAAARKADSEAAAAAAAAAAAEEKKKAGGGWLGSLGNLWGGDTGKKTEASGVKAEQAQGKRGSTGGSRGQGAGVKQRLGGKEGVGRGAGKGGKAERFARRDVAWLMEGSLAAGNVALAYSLLNACKTSALALNVGAPGTVRARVWPAAGVRLYASMVRGLAALLRVADAVALVGEVQRRGVPEGDREVSFGMTVDCPTCRKAFAVVQPQQGRQVVGCSGCKYEYELLSGDLISCDSETLIDSAPLLDKVLRLVRVKRGPPPAAVHSVVLRAPDGTSQINTFATTTPSVPAQSGERITLACAAPSFSSSLASSISSSLPSSSSSSSRSSPRKLAGIFPTPANRTPGWNPSEPMALTNHVTCQTLALLRAPPKAARDSGSLSLPPWLLPLGGALVAANVVGAAAVGMGVMEPNAITDGTVGTVVAWVAAGGAAAGGTFNMLVLPKLRELPGSVVDGMEVRQRLLEQHAALRQRLEALSNAAADEVRMLARMCQLQNKMQSIGQPSTYSARWGRVVEARKGLDQRLLARINLIDSYAKVLSMIEIEVEMDADVPTAEAAGAAANIADQIERLMEVESLQKEWQQQAEVNDEVERLLKSAPPLPETASLHL